MSFRSPEESFLEVGLAKQGELFLDHHVFENECWIRKPAQPHPTLQLTLSTDASAYRRFGVSTIPRVMNHVFTAIIDSGAQCCLWGWRECEAAGFTYNDLIPVKQKLNAVSKSTITIYGAAILRISGTSTSGIPCSSAVIAYVSPDVSGFYLSREAMVQLQIVNSDFPAVGSAPMARGSLSETVSAIDEECSCPSRGLPPGAPRELPFRPIPDNIEKMRDWLLERYKHSTFNTCPHQVLPCMEGPPIAIHINPASKPVAVHTPSPIPLHWQDKVQHDLRRDVALGVIEPVPHGEPSTWCHRMVLTRKQSGEPRRTVDLSPLNKHCLREVHAMDSPFELAKGVPENTWRTVVDAWNGFHSVPLRSEDKHLTTFVTPWGRFRYLRAPQGFASSGDGYNRRFGEILADFERHKRCVDDVLTYDDGLEQHWWRVIALLEHLAKHGVVVNPDKFQFSQKTVDFAGFRLTDTGIEPLPKYLAAIMNFPIPQSLTDVRSWFGLVNQVSHYAQLRDFMKPLRKFLSPKTKFYWDADLNELFEESKIQIIEAIKDGVQIFDPTRMTCLRCDWSKQGIGFYLCQKHCACPGRYPNCCEDGWRITLCGSRFLKPSESRYAPIEGEALAVAWSLEQTRYFTLGCDNLVVVVDHKPLTKILGDRTLDEITNTRLFRLKQRTLPWVFEICWMPGKGNSFSDATSRHPVLPSDDIADDQKESIAMVRLKSDLNNVKAVTWERVKQATATEYGDLLHLIETGFHDDKHSIDPRYRAFLEYKEGLFVHDGVIIYDDRVVIPESLRANVLETLHAAHQGVSTMTLVAQSAVFWPGITVYLQRIRDECRSCRVNAPSQAKLDPIPPIIPTTPFEAVVSDYFNFHGMHYLIIADRLSAWTEVYKIKIGSHRSGSSGLILLLKRFFATFGIPRELSSDGGSEYIAHETKDFLSRWGVHHRISSAYNPQSNGRAELAVKYTKRLLEDNISEDGNLDTDAFVRALLIKRNTPDPICKLSPAEVIFGRKLRDTLPRIAKSHTIFFDESINPVWRDAWREKESSLRTRYKGILPRLMEHSRPLPPLAIGDKVAVQNQSGSKPNKWDRTGVVLEVRDHAKYVVKIDGSGRLTLRNRRYLKKLYPDSGMFTSTPTHPVRSQRRLVNHHRKSDASSSTPDDLTVPQEEDAVPTEIEYDIPFIPHTPPTDMPNSILPAELPQEHGTEKTHNPPHDSTVPDNEVTRSPIVPDDEVTHRPSVPDDGVTRRSRPQRDRKATKCYDPSTGSYVERNPRGY